MVTVNISSAVPVNLQPPLNYKVAMLFLEMNTGSISSCGRISKLCLLLNGFVSIYIYLQVSHGWRFSSEGRDLLCHSEYLKIITVLLKIWTKFITRCYM